MKRHLKNLIIGFSLVPMLFSSVVNADAEYVIRRDRNELGVLAPHNYYYLYKNSNRNKSFIARDVEFRVNNRVFPFSYDAKTYVVDDRTYIPFRALGEAIGARVSWYPKELTAAFEKDGNIVKIDLENKRAYVNNSLKENYDNFGFHIYEDRTMVPLRFVVENLGLNVEWMSERFVANLVTDNKNTPTTSTPTKPNNPTPTPNPTPTKPNNPTPTPVTPKEDNLYYADYVSSGDYEGKVYKKADIVINGKEYKNKGLIGEISPNGGFVKPLIPVSVIVDAFNLYTLNFENSIIIKATKPGKKPGNREFNNVVLYLGGTSVYIQHMLYNDEIKDPHRFIDNEWYLSIPTLEAFLDGGGTVKMNDKENKIEINVDDLNAYIY